MPVPYYHYRDAKETLRHIHELKCDMEKLLYARTSLPSALAPAHVEDYRHALACIHEIIDELFQHDSLNAHDIIEQWEQVQRRREQEECRSHPR